MPVPGEQSLAISLDDSRRFAELSGDFNPLHVDPVAARRTQFGGTVAHGIHAVLLALDAALPTCAGPIPMPATIAVTFSNPVRTGRPFTARWNYDAGTRRMRLSAEAENRPAFSLTLEAAETRDEHPRRAVPEHRWPGTAPEEVPYPPQLAPAQVPVTCNAAVLDQLFPRLADSEDIAWVADLLATTRIVGMQCPGLHSIYSGLKLRRTDVPGVGASGEMQFEIERLDPRFRLARLRVHGVALEGTLDTFFRPPPVQQPTLTEIAPLVRPDEFAAQRALVIGGSRGLGETAAKILLAGGAEVTLTYARGQADAERVAAEARQFAAKCFTRPFDITAPDAIGPNDWLRTEPFSHAYFFASPQIPRNMTGHWDPAAFDTLAKFYVHGFAQLVQNLPRPTEPAQPVCWFYPSTVFLDTAEPGFAEYCAAKAAGEALAVHLSRAQKVVIRTPRLPRMRTDQTSGLTDVPMAEATDVLVQAFREFAS